MGERRITYVVSRWGEPTQTFVRREAAAVQAAGIEVDALSLKPLGPAAVEGIPAARAGVAAVATGVLAAAVRHPVRVARVLGTVTWSSHPRNVVRLTLAALTGIAWAGRGAVGPRQHLHAHFGWVAAAATWAAATVADVPYSVVLHAFELHTADRIDRFTAVPLRGARQVFAISDLDAAAVQARWGVPTATLRMGVPSHSLEATGDERDPWLVVSVGSLLPKKGHDRLLEALARADRRWRSTVVGEGPERPRLEQLAARLDLGDRVTFAGSRAEEEVASLLGRASVFALACRVADDGDRDGIPVATMEAMAAGLAVVTTRLGAIPELVEGAGELVAPDDVEGLAAALDGLVDPDRRRALGAAARARIEASFVAERAAEPVVALARGASADGR